MAYTFNSSQLAIISDSANQLLSQTNSSDSIDWTPAYQSVVTAIKEAMRKGMVDKQDRANVRAVYIWLKGALMVNSGVGRFSSIIRAYTQRQLFLHGADFSEQQVLNLMQNSSNKIGEAVIKDGILGEDKGRLATIDVIAERDAQQALDIVFSHIDKNDSAVRDGAAWSGAVLFGMFASPGVNSNDETRRLISEGDAGRVSTLEDFRNLLFAIDAYTFASNTAIAYTKEDKRLFWELVAPDVKAGLDGKALSRFFSSVSSLLNQSRDGGERLQKVLEGTTVYEPVQVMRHVGVFLLLDKLAAIFGYDIHTTNEEQFLRNARSLFGVITPEQLDWPFELLKPSDKKHWCDRARNSVAYRYALVTGTPFVITGDDGVYDRVNTDGRYSYNQVTEAYLDERCEVMERLLKGEARIF